MTHDAAEWWRSSGGAWLTGRADGPTLLPAGDVGAYLDGLSADLVFGRAAFMGAYRDGSRAPGGTARMLRCADGWLATNLARPADMASVSAIVEGDDGGDPFAAIARWSATKPARVAADRIQLFGVPAGVVGSVDPASAVVITRPGERAAVAGPRVADLTSLWAGPTCARLLAQRGAHVVKIESTTRPDGARRGSLPFYEWLHTFDAEEIRLDFGTHELRDELDQADVVLESSRPRALRHLGIKAEEWLAARPGRVWLSLTGYGRNDPEPGRVAFGDDAAAAGGLVAYEPGDDTPLFVGDAIADPLTGVTAARAVEASLANGGGELIAVALAGVAARVVADHPLEPSVIFDALPPQLPKPDH